MKFVHDTGIFDPLKSDHLNLYSRQIAIGEYHAAASVERHSSGEFNMWYGKMFTTVYMSHNDGVTLCVDSIGEGANED